MSEMLVLGDEALALGAIDAGLAVAYGYPGTPSTEILEYIQRYTNKNESEIIARWCTNEKTAYEGSVGVSYAGKRSLVTMKHVGLNVAADAFMNSALIEINGGLVLAVADDPGMHSSQNEQDSRYFADFARIMCFEPRNHQEAYDMTIEAFHISELFHIPVMLKLVTRLSHSRSIITRNKTLPVTDLGTATDKLKWMSLPALSRGNWKNLLNQQEEFEQYSVNSSFNKLSLNKDFKNFGVITTGLGSNYYLENLEDLPIKPSHLHIGVYPVPAELIKKLAQNVDSLIVVEEGYPFVEKMLNGIIKDTLPVHGKMNGALPAFGELNPDNVRVAIGLEERKNQGSDSTSLPGRPPQLCAGCPHTDSFRALNVALENYDTHIVTGDIGCYALGALPPHSALDALLCMGASIGMARGASEAGRKNVVASIGDSTFLHSGVTALIDAASTNTNMTLIIMDNSTTAMTGMQDTIMTSPMIKNIVLACGVDPDHLRELKVLPKNHDENTKTIKEEIDYEGLSVIITLRECIHVVGKIRGEIK
ncbi:MAG: thiamine pyrophosphate-dependent enzyme [Spirochaetia bacterium]|jgi:indolepyruvate ferredoxin oxidoreductase alpha subunit|nr:thiamine pyrophosphate-dependent enzyme [Spirochaetia bacterium]